MQKDKGKLITSRKKRKIKTKKELARTVLNVGNEKIPPATDGPAAAGYTPIGRYPHDTEQTETAGK